MQLAGCVKLGTYITTYVLTYYVCFYVLQLVLCSVLSTWVVDNRIPLSVILSLFCPSCIVCKETGKEGKRLEESEGKERYNRAS